MFQEVNAKLLLLTASTAKCLSAAEALLFCNTSKQIQNRDSTHHFIWCLKKYMQCPSVRPKSFYNEYSVACSIQPRLLVSLIKRFLLACSAHGISFLLNMEGEISDESWVVLQLLAALGSPCCHCCLKEEPASFSTTLWCGRLQFCLPLETKMLQCQNLALHGS